MPSTLSGIIACMRPDPESRRASVLAQMLADARLPEDVQPAPLAPQDAARGRRVLLTGATGFVGRHTARRLLLDPALRLYCLVRGADHAHATERLARALAGVGVPMEAMARRVEVLRGDVAARHFGLDAARWAALAREVGEVVHCAAEVNWARGYAQLRHSHVCGTLEVLRFACSGAAKPVAFTSTIAVCFTASCEGAVDEQTDLLPQVADLPLGYAQGKCVAESLLRQAAARGLPVRILRPALIAGDSSGGDVNLDDLIAALVEGNAAAGAAMDADWLMDCVPVDTVADLLARPVNAGPLQVLHLVHPQPRRWREVVLWMNLYGCPVRLLAPAEWLELAFARRATARTRLFAYRRFFAGPAMGRVAHPFEAFLAPQQQRVSAQRSAEVLAAMGVTMPPLDAALLHRYFERYREAGLLPAAPARTAAPAAGLADFESLLRRRFARAALRVSHAEPRPMAVANGLLHAFGAARLGGSVGLSRWQVQLGRPGHGALRLDLVAKAQPPDALVEALTVEVARVCDPALGALFDRHRGLLGLAGTQAREGALYALRAPAMRRHAPRSFGFRPGSPASPSLLLMEHLADIAAGDAADAAQRHGPAELAAALEGLAALQRIDGSAWQPLRDAGLLRPPPSTAAMLEGLPLWQAVADFAAPTFAAWQPAWPTLQRRLLETLAQWWPRLLALPQGLVHQDFNPRNTALRRTAQGLRLVAFDWELAGLGAPQRDWAEYLCFVAGAHASEPAFVETWVMRHRDALGVHATGAAWRCGFALALRQFALVRLPMYALAQRFGPQGFLPGVVRAACALLALSEPWLQPPAPEPAPASARQSGAAPAPCRSG